MVISQFIADFEEAFCGKATLPIVFWYSETPAAQPLRVNGCMFKALPRMRAGETVTFDAESITCGGGKLYCGYAPMAERIAQFVSLKERYKQTPEMVVEYVDSLGIRSAQDKFLNFVRIDKLDDLDQAEGVIFIADPDILSGLFTWVCFDNNEPQAVTSMFGSGCSSMITQPVVENAQGGRRTFLGGFDPSVRPFFGPNELTLAVPAGRFRQMCQTMRQSCLFDTHAWKKVQERISGQE